MRSKITFVLFLGVILLAADGAWAQTADNSLDRILEVYRNSTRAWEGTLQTFALRLFWLLAFIEFSFAALMLVWRNADFAEWLSEVVTQVLFIGFFLGLLMNASNWARAIVDSFRSAANAAAQANGIPGGMSPSDIFDVGVQVAGQFVSATSLWSPAASLGLLISGLVIVVCFAFIAAFMIAALVESYVVISAGVLFMGFGGSRWTKDFTIKILVYAVSVGAKLFILQLLVALGAQIFRDLAANVQTSNESLFVIIGSAIVMLAVVKTVPEMVQGLINGTSFGTGALPSVAAAGAAGTAKTAYGGGMAVRGADRLAQAQLAEADQAGTAPTTAAGRQTWLVGRGIANLGRALAANIGHRMGGRAAHGTRFAQTGLALQEEATRRQAALSERNNQNQNPVGTGGRQ